LDGKWDNYTNYDKCHLPTVDHVAGHFEPVVELPTIIYYTGYTISLVSLCLAVVVFIHFK
jgi:corticotropin releasing hormone receptor 1